MLAIAPEGPHDGPEIDHLLDLSFGPDRRNKVSYRYRPGIAPVAGLCLVARDAEGRLAGAVRYWPVRLGTNPALLLGPLAIDPARQGRGIGRALMRASLASAEAAGHRLVFLVGDPAYYARHGFRVVPPAIRVPDEEPGRVQYLTLAGAALPPEGGELLRADGRSVAAGGAAEVAPARRHAARAPRPLRRQAADRDASRRHQSGVRR
jgi:predicted N-acetyltransferase YhbS